MGLVWESGPVSPLPLAELVRVWLAEAELRPRSADRYVYSLMSVVRFGVTQLDQLTTPTLMRFVTERRAAGITASTVKKDMSAVRAFLRWAHLRGDFPARALYSVQQIKIKLPVAPPPRYLSLEEWARLRSACRARHSVLGLAAVLCIETGARTGELRSFLYEDFELKAEDPFVRVCRTNGRENKGKRDRRVPLTREFADELLRLGFGEKRGPVFPAGAGRRSHRPSSSPYVGTKALEDWLADAREAADLDDGVTFITLRHTYASWRILAGDTIEEVADALGHSIQVCWRFYVGLLPGGNARVTARRSAGLGVRVKPSTRHEQTTRTLKAEELPDAAKAPDGLEQLRAAIDLERAFAIKSRDEVSRLAHLE